MRLGLLDGKESPGINGGDVANTQDSNIIGGISVGQTGPAEAEQDYSFAEILPAAVQGLVWEDANDNGEVDLGEFAIPDVTITLNGTDDRGHSVDMTQATDGQGIFEFVVLRPGTYALTQLQPSGYIDGKEVVGSVVELPPDQVRGVDGIADADTLDTAEAIIASSFSQIELVAGSNGVNYNFGERIDGGELTTGQTATIGFWQNKNGQNLIKSLNGGPASTVLASYLSDTFPNMNGNLGLFEGELAEWLGAEDGESIPLFGPVYVKPGSGPYWWASFWTKDLRPGDRIVDIVVYDPFPDGSLKGSGTVIRREGWHTTLFAISEELNIEGYDGVITGNFNFETGAYKTVFIPRNGPPIKADVVPFDGLWLADRLTNIIALDTDPDSGERFYLCDAE